MTATSDDSLQEQLSAIKHQQDALMLIARQHLELYSQQLAKTNELNNYLLELQKRSYQSQIIVMSIATLVAVATALFIILS